MILEPMTYQTFLAKGILGHIVFPADRDPNSLVWLVALAFLIAAAAGYFLGSLNFGVILSKTFFHDDVRLHGSGNAGMTNMLRNYGVKAALFTLLGDALKAVVSVYIGFALFGRLTACVAGLLCMLGHIFPIYYKFRGGKGAVTAIVMILFLNPLVGAILLLIFAIIVIGTRYVSLGSIMSAALYPLILNRISILQGYTPNIIEVVCSFLVAFLIVFMHRSNIKRLLAGTENKLSIGKKKKTKEDSSEADSIQNKENEQEK
ncbi:MAG: glycerol-3-phosphate 1-O-acyltransferase PlsY [Ruminococcaceae bacterium]|nr:glycerol-3-phosphate 1-O-acyltransferase PlsY [Oscillospiraceae bacterium]